MSKAAELRFVQLGALALRLHQTDPAAVCAELGRHREQAPAMLAEATLLLDVSAIETSGEALRALVAGLESQGYPVAGLVAGVRATALAEASGLRVIGRASFEQRAAGAQHRADPEPATTLRIDRPVRSGQQIYARGGDLVVLANIGAGAEVIADGSIHIYGSLRGRALAGARGNENARIYCLDFQAELVSVAGTYKVFEELPAGGNGEAVQAWLDGGQIRLDPLAGR